MLINCKVADPRCFPLRAHTTDAGADLFSTRTLTIEPGCREFVDTGVAVKIPESYVGLVFSRSGQGKIGVSLANSVGVIDSDYRGNIGAFIENHGTQPYHIKEFETKVCQLVIVPIVLASFEQNINKWDDTVRGVNGFGSTGG